ncbi:DUF3667 domain-containing protein [uncultured Arenimonas sp.]|uniref:DUF3667 domain-containing protein n=1 Tax=uncultured Arenimonas sp. TaxID=546226 RepID=UPI0030D7C111
MSAETQTPQSEAPATPERRCANCGVVLLGEHCYACGQPTKGLVRHFSSIIGDFMDSVFELDSRILRTLGPLLFKPGALSLEYFEGRRVRYVSPVRLFVFLSLFAFFAAQLRFDFAFNEPPVAVTAQPGEAADTAADDEAQPTDETPDELKLDADGSVEGRQVASMRAATTVAEVERLRDEALAELSAARAKGTGIPGVDLGVEIGMDVASEAVRKEAQRRIAEIDKAVAAGEPVPVSASASADAKDTLSFNGEPWHPVDNPLVIDWLGPTGNAWVNAQVGRAEGNIERIKKDPNLLQSAFLSMVPTTLFILLPLFAVLLKIMYVFKKRLYMEHLIVALHSHSFLCGGLLLVVILDALSAWTSGWAWLSRPLGWLEVAMLCWMPVYLLIMQKRVYRQGWIMTLFKYWVLGSCYLVLIGIGATFALMASLVYL